MTPIRRSAGPDRYTVALTYVRWYRLRTDKALIFDFNGTLFWDTEYHKAAWSAISKRYRGVEVSRSESHHLNGRTNAETIAYLLGRNPTASEVRAISEEKEGLPVPDINIIFKIAGVGILISILNMVLKQADKEEQAQMLTLVGVVVVLLLVIQLIQRLFHDVRAVFGL